VKGKRVLVGVLFEKDISRRRKGAELLFDRFLLNKREKNFLSRLSERGGRARTDKMIGGEGEKGIYCFLP
jgi:hypothetical protein